MIIDYSVYILFKVLSSDSVINDRYSREVLDVMVKVRVMIESSLDDSSVILL